jgi:hypothetical protein
MMQLWNNVKVTHDVIYGALHDVIYNIRNVVDDVIQEEIHVHDIIMT